MPQNEGIHYALVEESRRLMRIIEVLKEADHPLSAKEIAIRAYDFTKTGELMVNVSTNIGEIRGMDNINAGYVVSPATRFHPEKGEAPRYPWHDGRPRYWLIAAPGWAPRWTVSGEGGVLEYQHQGARVQGQGYSEPRDPAPRTLDPMKCQNPGCGRELPEGHEGPPFCPGPNDGCRSAFLKSLQGTLF